MVSDPVLGIDERCDERRRREHGSEEGKRVHVRNVAVARFGPGANHYLDFSPLSAHVTCGFAQRAADSRRPRHRAGIGAAIVKPREVRALRCVPTRLPTRVTTASRRCVRRSDRPRAFSGKRIRACRPGRMRSVARPIVTNVPGGALPTRRIAGVRPTTATVQDGPAAGQAACWPVSTTGRPRTRVTCGRRPPVTRTRGVGTAASTARRGGGATTGGGLGGALVVTVTVALLSAKSGGAPVSSW